MPSLHEIQRTVSTLWVDKQAREWLLSDRKTPPPACLRNADPEILRTVDARGVELYGELLTFGHHDVMASVYPFCSKLLGKRWDGVVDDYLRRFPADHFNFNRLCSRLPEYFSRHGNDLLEKYPFLAELADYEWIELEKMEEDRDITLYPHSELSSLEDIMALGPVINPTLTIRHYSFDVLSIAERLDQGSKPRKPKAKAISVAVYRHPEDQLCKFVELGEAAAYLVEQSKKLRSYSELIKDCLPLTGAGDPQAATVSVLTLIEELQSLKVFVGSVKVAAANR